MRCDLWKMTRWNFLSSTSSLLFVLNRVSSHFLIHLLSLSEIDGKFPKARDILGLMGFLGFANVYAMRVNLSVAIVAMVNSTREVPDFDNNTDVCPLPPFSNTTIPDVRIQHMPNMSHKMISPFICC